MKPDLYWTVDIGGTKMLMLLIDNQGEVLVKNKYDTPKPSEPAAIVDTISRALLEASKEKNITGADKPSGLGICIAGFVDHHKGLVYQSPNLEWHKPVPLGGILNDQFDCPVLIENDTNAAVVGEVYYGAARGHDNVIYITLSTGIGGGLFLNNRLYRGNEGFAGEIGHTKPFGKGRACKCGGNDCLETWASGSALAGSAATLWDENAVENGHISTSWVFDQADGGNILARSIIDHAANNIGLGLSNLVNILNPSCMVIGGGVAANRTDFFHKIVININKYAIRPAVEKTPLKIVPAALEPEAGIWGIYNLLAGRAV